MHYLNMALIDKASLLFVPSVVAQEKAFNILPSGNRAPDSTDQNSGYDQTRADFDFDRGSNAAATRIGSDGLIKKYRENLLLQSNQFDTTWTNYNSTETSGQADKDGGTDAWLLTKTGTNGNINQVVSSSGVTTFSVYAKANASDWIFVRIGAPSLSEVYFDVANGIVGTETNVIDSKIESVANGYYRCSITANISSGSYVRFYVADSDGVTSGTSGSIYIQNAQAETSMVSTDVLTSGATTAKAGVLIDLPRINYDANGENGSLLLEPSRQQLLQYSEYFNVWQNGGGTQTIVANATASPQGLQNASSIQIDSGYVYTQVGSLSISSGDKYVWSCYVNSSSQKLTFGGGTPSGTDVYTSEDVGGGWYRQILTRTFTSSGSGIQAMFNDAQSGTDLFYIWGAQLEAGSYVSSYIPNHGTSGGVTRAADSLFVESLADELTTGYTEATLYLEFKYKQESAGDAFVFGQDNGTYPAGRGYLYNKQVGFADTFGGGGFGNITEDTTLKLIYRLNSLSNADVFLNATKGTNVSGTAWSAINQIRFRGTYCRFEISEITMFNEALTDAECITLTTL